VSARLLDARTTAGRLSIGRSQLQNLLGLIPHVHIPATGTHLFPKIYVVTLANLLGEPATVARVRQFNRTPEAAQAVMQAQAELTAQMSVRDWHTAEQVAEILCVGIMTVHNWRQKRNLPFQEQTVRTERHSRQGRRVNLISTAKLGAALEWRIPPTLQP
jgi:hypothetical protein